MRRGAEAAAWGEEAVEDAGVFGVVTETTTGMSVLGNGQDGKNDAGQFAMIPKVPPGKSDVEFVFVSQQADDCVPSAEPPRRDICERASDFSSASFCRLLTAPIVRRSCRSASLAFETASWWSATSRPVRPSISARMRSRCFMR